MIDRSFVEKWSQIFGVDVQRVNCGTYTQVQVGNGAEKPEISQPLTENLARQLHSDVAQLLKGPQPDGAPGQLLSHIQRACFSAGDAKASDFVWRLHNAVDAKHAGVDAQMLGFDSIGGDWLGEDDARCRESTDHRG